MGKGTKAIIGLVAAVVLFGAYLAVASFTGKEVGEACNSDGECKGLDAACLIDADNEKYCTLRCETGSDCPSGWACEPVAVTNIDGQGNMSAGGSDNLCVRPAPAPAGEAPL